MMADKCTVIGKQMRMKEVDIEEIMTIVNAHMSQRGIIKWTE
jgi:hypothetical protein